MEQETLKRLYVYIGYCMYTCSDSMYMYVQYSVCMYSIVYICMYSIVCVCTV